MRKWRHLLRQYYDAGWVSGFPKSFLKLSQNSSWNMICIKLPPWPTQERRKKKREELKRDVMTSQTKNPCEKFIIQGIRSHWHDLVQRKWSLKRWGHKFLQGQWAINNWKLRVQINLINLKLQLTKTVLPFSLLQRQKDLCNMRNYTYFWWRRSF